jgi:dTDP-4-dehydrorhamnose 3,5-epimerase-like enzyme
MSLDNCSAGCSKFGNDLMVVDEVPNLISYLVSNGYTVDTSITKMFNDSDIRFDTNTGNKLICFVTYNG